MVYRTIIKDYHLLLSSIIIEEPKEFIDRIRKEYNAIIQIVDIDAITDIEHIEEVIKLVLEAYERDIMVSRHIEAEILLRIACTNQIYKAIEFAGAKPNKLSVFIALSKDASIIDELVSTLDLGEINYSNERYDRLLRYHKITDLFDGRALLIEKANLIY